MSWLNDLFGSTIGQSVEGSLSGSISTPVEEVYGNGQQQRPKIDTNDMGDPNGLSQNLINDITGKQSIDIAKQGIEDVMGMGKAYLQNQLAAANQDIYSKRQQMLEAQRRYGITGAVANAQAQDFELKAQQQLANVSNQSSMQWYQTVGSELKYYRQMEEDQKLSTIRGIASKIADNSMDQDTAFKSLSAIDPSITKEMVANAYVEKNRFRLDSIMRGLQNGVTPVKS